MTHPSRTDAEFEPLPHDPYGSMDEPLELETVAHFHDENWAAPAIETGAGGRKVLGWARVPAGKRASTYENPDYLKIAGAFAEPTQQAIENANPTDPGVQPRPTIGIQFVDIPDFTNFGTQASQYFSSAIAGQMSVDDALKKAQKAAQLAGDNYKSK